MTVAQEIEPNNGGGNKIPTIVYTCREPLEPKDFRSEVRGYMDVEQFASQGVIILDIQSNLSLNQAVSLMLSRTFAQKGKAKSASDHLEEAKANLFVADSNNLLAREITELKDDDSDRRSNWMCALCELPELDRRELILARFKQPPSHSNKEAKNSHSLRLLMLIVTGTTDKNTKSALEVARSFATLLRLDTLRAEILASGSDLEVRAAFISKARELIGTSSKLTNRVQYQFQPALQRLINVTNEQSCDTGPLNSSVCSSIDKLDQNNLFKKNPNASKLIELIYTGEHFDSSRIFDPSQGHESLDSVDQSRSSLCQLELGKGLCEDFWRRLRYYPSDFKDAFIGPPRTIEKTLATIWFLYFGILLPIIAFSSLNLTQTQGQMGDLRKSILGQAIGGLAFALVGGQPLVIIMTTAPLCLYTKVIYSMCADYNYPFSAMYAAVGLWNAFFLIIYSIFGFSRLMKWCTRSTEEVFAMFIVVAFITDATKDMLKNFGLYYNGPGCVNELMSGQVLNSSMNIGINSTELTAISLDETTGCKRDTSLLFLLLMLGTVWLATFLYRFNKSAYLASSLRNFLSDYALPISVICMSFMGSYIFREVYVEQLATSSTVDLEMASLESLPFDGILLAAGLGFTLSLLFFMDQNISAAMVCSPQHHLKKGSAYHYDLLVVGLLNVFLTLFGFPMMHGVLPHSPLHARSLSDIIERLEEGHLREYIHNCRENRVTALVAHILVFLSLALISNTMAYIPRAVLNGLFLYMALTSLDGLQIFERIMLMFTEQSRYPPNHYVRRCPQRKIHTFTLFQLLQLFVMCLFGFAPISAVEMFFPVIILAMIPFRHKIVTRFIEPKYLEALDGKH